MKRLLLDTHAFLWFVAGDERLSEHARSLIVDPATTRLLSVGSLWEMAIKSSLGRLTLALSFDEIVEQQVKGNAMEVLPIRPPHFDALRTLPFHHKDPFDRLLIAQAIAEDVPILSRDGHFHAYDVDVAWSAP